MKKTVQNAKAPAAIGPYSQAVVVNNLCYTSGQLPIDPETGVMPTEVEKQAYQSITNCFSILEAAGSCKENVVKTLVFLTNLEDFAKVNEVYAQLFDGCDYPARSCVEVSKLPKDAKIEIEMIGIVK